MSIKIDYEHTNNHKATLEVVLDHFLKTLNTMAS